jgi:hypothetical protein
MSIEAKPVIGRMPYISLMTVKCSSVKKSTRENRSLQQQQQQQQKQKQQQQNLSKISQSVSQTNVL